MLPTIERCWFVGIRMLLRRRKCAVWRPSDYTRWNDCFKEERAAVTVRGIVCYTPPSRGNSTIMVSLSFSVFCATSAVLPTSHYFPFMRTRRIWIWITGYYREIFLWIRIRNRSRRIFDGYYGFCSPLPRNRVETSFRSRILFLVMGRFFNLSLLSHHCPCDPTVVSRFVARDPEIRLSTISSSKLWKDFGTKRMWITLMFKFVFWYELEIRV